MASNEALSGRAEKANKDCRGAARSGSVRAMRRLQSYMLFFALCMLLSGSFRGLCACPVQDPETPASIFPSPSHALPPSEPRSDEELTVTGEGMAAFTGDVAAAQEEAVWDAKRNAVEQAVGIFLKAKTLGSAFGLEEDEIQGRTQGFVRRWEIIEGSRRIEAVPVATSGGTGKTDRNAASGSPRLLHIQVRAMVGLLSLARRLADIADVYKDLERPRVRVLITAAPERALLGNQGHKEAAANRWDAERKAENADRNTDENAARTALRETSADAARRMQEQLAGALRAQGFDVASEGSAEIVLQGALDVMPTVRIGDASAPYGVGDMLAACRAHLTLQAISTASEDVLFVRQTQGAGRSFQSDQEAQNEAVAQVAEAVLRDNEAQFVPYLLARWARERQEGHVVVVRADGLDARQRGRLRQALADMRGFRRFVEETSEKTAKKTLAEKLPEKNHPAQTPFRITLRFLTRRDTRSIRRDLAALLLPAFSAIPATAAHASIARSQWTQSKYTEDMPLRVLNDRGPVINCAATPSAGTLKAPR